MNRYLAVLMGFLLCSCSSLDKYRDYVSTIETRSESKVNSTCSQGKDFETLQTVLSSGANISLNISTTRHFAFVGIPLIPFVPMWRNAKLLEIAIQSPDPIKFDKENFYLKIGDERLSPSRPVRDYSQAECGTEVSVAEKLKAAQTGIWPKSCNVTTAKLIFFQFSKDQFPDKIQIGLDGIQLQGKRADLKELTFQRSSHWRYNAFSTRETGGPARCP